MLLHIILSITSLESSYTFILEIVCEFIMQMRRETPFRIAVFLMDCFRWKMCEICLQNVDILYVFFGTWAPASLTSPFNVTQVETRSIALLTCR